MRKIQKILNTFKGLSCSVCLLVPTVLSSCTSSNNDHKKQDVTIFKNETIKQFWNLTTFGPHYSDISEEELQHGNLKAIKGYYKDLIKSIGLEWYEQPDRTEGGKVVSEGNAFFDIPASNGKEDVPTIILQGHIDMVEVHDEKQFPESEGGFPKETYQIQLVETVDKDGEPIIVSDGKTNIGADNGAGIASLLTLAILRDDFQHGKIRCLFTTNEENTFGGDHNADWGYYENSTNGKRVDDVFSDGGKPIQYLLNVDSESINDIYTATQGGDSDVIACAFDQSLIKSRADNEFANYTWYTFSVSGFKGGHSGIVYDQGYYHPLPVILDALNSISVNFESINLCGISSKSTAGETDNNVPNEVSVTFGINTNGTDKTKEYEEKLNKSLDDILDKYPIEKATGNAKCSVTNITNTTTYTNALVSHPSQDILNFLNAVHYGVLIPMSAGEFQSSQNVAPISLNLDDANSEFSTAIYHRGYSSSILSIIEENKELLYGKYINKEKYGASMTSVFHETPWFSDLDQPLIKLICDGYQETKLPYRQSYAPGAAELSVWASKRPDMYLGVIGVKMKDPHELTETLYLNGLDDYWRILLYVLTNLGA